MWLVRDLPEWLVGLVIVAGLPALVLGLDEVIHRRLPHRRLGRHNLVTGVMVSVVGIAYGIMIGMCVVSLWDGFSDAQDTTRQEAANLAGLVPGSGVFGAATERQMTDEVIRYNQDVVDDWQRRTAGDPSPDVTADLRRLADLLDSLRPTTAAQHAFVQDAVARVNRGEELHQRSLIEANDQQMSSVMWLGVICVTCAILTLILLFGLDDGVLRRVLLVLASIVVATNLFLIVQMNYPYHGSFAVGPDSFIDVIEGLRAG